MSKKGLPTDSIYFTLGAAILILLSAFPNPYFRETATAAPVS